MKGKKELSVITSTSNSTIKFVKNLHQRKHREREGKFFVEGVKMVQEAIASELKVDCILMSEDSLNDLQGLRREAEQKRIRVLAVSGKVFGEIADTQTPQGVLAVMVMPEHGLNLLLNREKCLLVVLDCIQDPGNMGTIIRTMDAAGGDGVILLKGCTDPFGMKAVRSTMGSIYRVPVLMVEERQGFFSRLSSSGFHIVASHLKGQNIFKWGGGHRKTALVIGNEAHGVAGDIEEFADSLVKIPMVGGAESLNASVAAGILIYEIFRKGMNMDE